MNLETYNNLAIASYAINSVLSENDNLPISKALLIMPLINSKSLLDYLSRKTTETKSIEKIITFKTSCFSNFNDRYYDCLGISLNAIQLLIETNQVKFNEGVLVSEEKIKYDKSLGKRAKKIFDASKNINNLLLDDTYKLYLNLRIEL